MQTRPKPSASISCQHGPRSQIHRDRGTTLGNWPGKPASAVTCKRPSGALKLPSHQPAAQFTHSITKTLAASTLGGFPTRVVRSPRRNPHAATRIRKPSPELPFVPCAANARSQNQSGLSEWYLALPAQPRQSHAKCFFVCSGETALTTKTSLIIDDDAGACISFSVSRTAFPIPDREALYTSPFIPAVTPHLF